MGAPVKPGKRGEAKAYEIRADYWRGKCPYRLLGSPKTEYAQAYATTKTEARAAAAQKADDILCNRKVFYGKGFDPKTTVAEVVMSWFAEHRQLKTNKRPQSFEPMRACIHPSKSGKSSKATVFITTSKLGQMRAADVRTTHVATYLESISHTAEKCRKSRDILIEAFAYAARHGLELPCGNPARETERPDRNPEDPRALTPAEFELYRQLEADYFAKHPRTDADRRYRDLVALTFELAARGGEATGVALDDIEFGRDDEGDYALVSVTGTVVRSKDVETGKQLLFRQDDTKMGRAKYVTVRNRAVVSMLRRRKLAAHPGQRLLFVTRSGGPLSLEEGMGRIVRLIRAGSELEWVTPKTLRKTAATWAEIQNAGAATKLGGWQVEGDSSVKRKHYVDRAQLPREAVPGASAYVPA